MTMANSPTREEKRPLHVVVVVLGDLGRSPRMQYHALSLLQEGYSVTMIGYTGEELIPLLQQHQDNRLLDVIRFETSSPKALRKILPFYYIWRLINLVGGLLMAFWSIKDIVDCVLVQNPPAIPLLLVAYLYCKFANTIQKPRLVVDWHNLGYTMLRPGRIRRLAQWYERKMAPLADGNLCVTAAMKDFLVRDMNVKPERTSVLYDCPPHMFRPLSLDEQHAFLRRLQPELIKACPASWHLHLDPERQTPFTEEIEPDTIVPRSNRPLLITSSTSWTEDEDFDMLLDALVGLNEKLSLDASPRCVMVVVTGKGPLKAFYEEKISKLALPFIAVQTLWLEPEDYPRILACADVGVSLHSSTSGLDLPMKVLDLFGCQTPVCALHFNCLSELVVDGVNGHVFRSSLQLTNQLHTLFQEMPARGSPHSFGNLQQFSQNLQDRKRWAENWKEHALPIISPNRGLNRNG